MRTINTRGLNLIKSYESLPGTSGGPALQAYMCPAGVWTIGWGHTGPDVKAGMTITHAEAQRLLDKDLDWAEDVVDANAGPATDNQFDAMVSLAFNIGAAGFKSSSVLRLHRAGKFNEAAQAFSLWRKATVGGQLVDMPGLVRRRNEEATLYLTPDTAKSAAAATVMPQAVTPEKPVTRSTTVVTGSVGAVAGVAALADQVQPVVEAVRQAAEAAAGAATSLGAVEAAAMSLLDGPGLVGLLTAVAVVCTVAVVWRYVIKARRGDVTVT